MEAIAENPYRFEVRPMVPAVYDTKGHIVSPSQRRVFIQFERGNAPAYVQEIGLKSFEFKTKVTYEHGDEYPSELWLAYYDSEADQIIKGWTDEERAEIETHLPTCPGVLIVERPKLPKPVPAYWQIRRIQGRRTAELVVDELVSVVRTTGIDPGVIVAFERQEQKPGWELMVARMEQLLEEQKPVETEQDELVTA